MTRETSQSGSSSADGKVEMTRVLLVDDDPRLLVTLGRGLSLRGFEVASAESAGRALPLLETDGADILVLDVTMPGMDGISFCRLIRDRFQLPILMLTARDDVTDRVAGLEAGADDYLIKPFALDELVARIKALLRRVGASSSQPLSFQDLRLDREQWLAYRGDECLALTTTEFRLLEQLLVRPGAVVSRDALLDLLWGDGAQPETNAIDVHIRNLRRKLEVGGASPLVQTVRGVGYRLQSD